MPDAHVTPGQYLVARKTLTSAQVLAIHATPVQVIAAPGSGRMLVPIAAVFNYTFVTTAYTDGGGSLSLLVNSNSMAPVSSVNTLGFWDQTSSRVYFDIYTRNPLAVTALANFPLMVTNATASPTLGDGTLTVTVAYLVVPVS